jgi:hypothetical protein
MCSPVDGIRTRAAAVVASRAFQRLRPQQRTWFLEFVGTGNPLLAAQAAYPAATAKSQKFMVYEIRRSPRIRAALQVWRNQFEEFAA